MRPIGVVEIHFLKNGVAILGAAVFVQWRQHPFGATVDTFNSCRPASFSLVRVLLGFTGFHRLFYRFF